LVALSGSFYSCQSQTNNTEVASRSKVVGGSCEGCEAVHEYGDRVLASVDTIPEFVISEPKLKLTGTVYKKDGKTPAKNVILYIYHTNREGIYPKQGNESGWAKRHGYLRGWVKTDQYGHYTFFTFRPGAYPGRNEPEHIHITVKEPHQNAYYIDGFVFDSDPILSQKARTKLSNRGGSGIVKLTSEDRMLIAKRDIILGLNIPDYE